MAKRTKRVGKTGPTSIGTAGVQRQYVEFPTAKEDIELFIARLFCAAKAGMRSQIARYGSFTELEQQPEDRPDFTVQTDQGKKWLELAEFAPLQQFGHAYEKVPAQWDAATMIAAVRSLIDKTGRRRLRIEPHPKDGGRYSCGLIPRPALGP